MKENGVEFPAALFEAWLDEVYGENGDEIKEVFACPEDTDECNDSLDRFLTSVNWACNSKNALFEIIKNNREYGPIYPMEFRHPTCAAVDGKNTRRWVNVLLFSTLQLRKKFLISVVTVMRVDLSMEMVVL